MEQLKEQIQEHRKISNNSLHVYTVKKYKLQF